MTIFLDIKRNHVQPIYRQIVGQIKQQISVGNLPAGTRLPPVRQLAESIGVTRLTVHNAYSELQSCGWVEARVGSGTFVSEGFEHDALLAVHLEKHKLSMHYATDMHQMIQSGRMHSMAYAVPGLDMVPGEEFLGIFNEMRADANHLLHYGGQDGDMQLRLALTSLLAERGLMTLPDNILVTNGATQGLALVTQLLTSRGDSVLTEHPTYLGQMKVFEALGVNSIGVPMDGDGPLVDEMERLIKQHSPRFISLVPNYHNPTGIVVSEARRQDILKLSYRYDLPIVEDDIYAMLSYDGTPPPPLKQLDVHDNVIYISSVSKIISPGLRIGYLVAPPRYQSRLTHLKWSMELSSAQFLQRALAIYLREGRLKSHLRRVLPIYRGRRDAMLSSLERYMPPEVTWNNPSGGFLIWVKVPDAESLRDLYPAALRHGVGYTPNEAFYTTEEDSNYYMRLCFSTHDAASNDAAVCTLSNLIKERLTTQSSKRKVS